MNKKLIIQQMYSCIIMRYSRVPIVWDPVLILVGAIHESPADYRYQPFFHPERSEGSSFRSLRCFAALCMTATEELFIVNMLQH